MHQKVAVIAIFAIFISVINALAGGFTIIWSYGGEKIIKVMDLPDTSDFMSLEKEYIDVGVKYKQLRIMFLPVWNYDVQWCGYIGRDDQYLDLSRTELETLANAASLHLPSRFRIPLWDALGGKLIFSVLLALILIGFGEQSKDEETGRASTDGENAEDL